MYIHKHTDRQKYLPTLTERGGGQGAKGREREREMRERMCVSMVYTPCTCVMCIYTTSPELVYLENAYKLKERNLNKTHACILNL